MFLEIGGVSISLSWDFMIQPRYANLPNFLAKLGPIPSLGPSQLSFLFSPGVSMIIPEIMPLNKG